MKKIVLRHVPNALSPEKEYLLKHKKRSGQNKRNSKSYLPLAIKTGRSGRPASCPNAIIRFILTFTP
jgi:hypothetical protein